jgi:hypothetical protein
VADHLAAGRVPRLLALTVAAFAACLEMPEVHDPMRGRHDDVRSLAAALFPDAPEFVDLVVELHAGIR